MEGTTIRNLIIRIAAVAVVGIIGYGVTDRAATAVDKQIAKRLPVPQLDQA